MPPKKREKDPDNVKTPRIDHIQADHELFLQAFEKPTQIYRYLRTRNMCSPIFLNRTLTYMRQRMSRVHKHRQNFKVDSLLDKVVSRRDSISIQPGFINLTFLSFNNKSLDYNAQIAQVETVLLKISHKKRKDSSAPSMQITLGTADVPINPDDQQLPLTAPTISIPTESFNPSSGPLVKSYIILFRVKVTSEKDSGDEEPALKKRKSNGTDNTKLYGAELTVYDKHNRCYLSDGDYDIVVHDFSGNPKNNLKKHSSWESVNDLVETCGNLDAFMKGAVLKFKLNWSPEASARIVDRPPPYPLQENKENVPLSMNGDNNNVEKLQIVYQFVYNNNSRQQTEACEDLHCPWCSLNCNQLYTLLKHLKLCHSRFTFTYVPISVGARIDVAINEMYDGSYTGSPHDLISQPSVCAFSRSGPVRRASVTHILVCHPKRPKPSLSEFLELDDCEFDGQRPFITGHNRLYHHTTTYLPIYPKEMDVDSEGENDPEWLQNKTMMMIDEFTDVNEGEKELMKMWNLHVMKHGFVGDCQIPIACQLFVQYKGKELLLKNLYKNFVIHMTSLFDFGLVSAVCLYTTIQKLQELVGETSAIRTVLKESREAQIDNWSRVGNVPPICDKPNMTKTPSAGRKTANVGMQRRKGTPTPCEPTSRRKSVCGETSRKRLTLTLKSDQKSS
ncbi:polycomb protein Su(z)12 [Leptinotarsa decemlineata]|uniref:polycomb protein Su(z)12 n=1 Tax=Leptinotarsa decemlineata TaxID=7539 RepID=UPI000C25217B|nr:polycomb protein SUZ12 [Leptinotarsa decemlineata]